jgi:ribosomal protein S19
MTTSRSSWKVPSTKRHIVAKLKNSKIPVKILNRSSLITPNCVGFKFSIHNGKSFLPLEVTSAMVGHKFGEFSFTRQKFKFNK